MQVGPHICCLKTHVDIFNTWDPSTAAQLRQLADKHGALATLTTFDAGMHFEVSARIYEILPRPLSTGGTADKQGA